MLRMPAADLLRTRRGMAVVLGALGLISAALYLPAVRYGFVWDDPLLITRNRLLAETGPLAVFSRPFWAGASDASAGAGPAYYRPLTTFSFWLDLHIAGRAAWYFHLVNLLLNTLATLLVTLLIWGLLHSGVWAALGGLLFACHPGHVESVAFISGRTDLLLTVFLCAAAFALLRSVRKRDLRWWPLVLGAFALALLSKETALLFPVLVALAPLLLQTRYTPRYWLLAAAAVAVAAGYLSLRALVLHQALPPPAQRFAVHDYLNVASTFGLYVRMFIWPLTHKVKFPADLAFHHLSTYTVYALVFVVSVPLAVLRRRFWVSLWGYAWAICFLLPVSNIIPVGPQAAERLLYLPSVGLVLALVTLLSRSLGARQFLRQVVAVLLLCLTGGFAADTVVRSRVWQNERTLFGTMVREAPRAPSAYAGLAGAVQSASADSAIKLYNRALFFDQRYLPAHINLGIIYSQRGDHRRAIHQLRLAKELQPSSPAVQTNLGLAYLNAAELDSALAAFDRATRFDNSLGQPHLGRALALTFAGRSEDAAAALRAALSRDPGLLRDVQDLGRSLVSNPGQRLGTPVGINRLGSLLTAAGDTALAETCYSRSLDLDPTCVPALYNSAVLSVLRGDSARARTLAARALRLRPDLIAVRQLCESLAR